MWQRFRSARRSAAAAGRALLTGQTSPGDDEAAFIELNDFRAENANRAKIIECCFRLASIVRQDDVAAHEIHAFLGSEIPHDDTSNAENAKTGKSRERFLRVALSRANEYCERVRHRTSQQVCKS